VRCRHGVEDRHELRAAGSQGRVVRVPLFCSPLPMAADTRAKRVAYRLMPTGRGQWVFFAAVAIAITAAPGLPREPGLAVDLVATVAASAWCLVNFWRCREAHCIVTGIGWTALAVLIAIELAVARSFVLGSEGLVFLAILVVGVGFEAQWRLRHGTNALVRDH
jgi:hypothetical protein